MYIHSTPPAQALLLGFNGTNSNFAGSKGGFTAEPQKFSLTPIRIWTSLMARNSQHCSEFLEKKNLKMDVCIVLLLWWPEEQSHLKEVQLAQGTKELKCSKPKQASGSSASHTKIWSVASSLGLVF